MDASFDYTGRIIPATETTFIVPAAAVGGLLLDSLSATSAIAYSTRKLRSAYAGAALQIYRTSDAANQDIGFDGSGNLDTTSLLAFIGASSGLIKIWYDQSGNGTYGANAIDGNAGATGFPLVNSGTLSTLNAKAAPTSSNATSWSTNYSLAASLSQPDTIAIVAQATALDPVGTITDVGGATGRQFVRIGPTQYSMYAGSGPIAGGTTDTNSHGLVCVYNGVSSNYYVDNTSVVAGDAGTNVVKDQQLSTSAGQGLTGFIAEIIIFTSALGAPDRSTLRTNWNAYWGTP